MKINITNKQYGQLLELSYIARWMMEAIKGNQPAGIEEIEQYLLSSAKSFGHDSAVVFDEKSQKNVLSRDFVKKSNLMPFIDEYDNNIFWEELVYRLGWRDVLAAYSEEKLAQMTEEDRQQLASVYIDRYAAEFEANGLTNLTIADMPAAPDKK